MSVDVMASAPASICEGVSVVEMLVGWTAGMMNSVVLVGTRGEASGATRKGANDKGMALAMVDGWGAASVAITLDVVAGMKVSAMAGSAALSVR